MRGLSSGEWRVGEAGRGKDEARPSAHGVLTASLKRGGLLRALGSYFLMFGSSRP